jgi:hypothetical protein
MVDRLRKEAGNGQDKPGDGRVDETQAAPEAEAIDVAAPEL